MIAQFIQEVITQFSLRTLYIAMFWFASFGYLMHVFVVMALTRLPFFGLFKNMVRLQFMTIAGSYLIAPVLATMSIMFSQLLSAQYLMWFAGQQVYIWFTICMMFMSSMVLCQVFTTISCARFGTWLIVTNFGVGLIGIFVLKAMNLLVMM